MWQSFIKHSLASIIRFTKMFFIITVIMTMTILPSQIFILSLSSSELCSMDNSAGMSYFAQNVSTQKCECKTCLRRCCKPGYVYSKYYCHWMVSDILNVTLYTNKTVFDTQIVDIKRFSVGFPECSAIFLLNSSIDKFYIQTDYSVWIPTYKKFYSSDRYCVDANNGFSFYLCFSEKSHSKFTIIGE